MVKMQVEIIIPSKNELENLKIIMPIVRRLYNFNILVIDKSNNFKEVKKFCEKFKKTRYFFQKTNGKGNALKEASQKAKGNILVFFDADCSHDAGDIKKLIKPLMKDKRLDHVGGSRMRGGSDELFADKQHFFRLFGSLIINYVINLKFNTNLTDSQNGLRAIKKSVFKSCKILSRHTSIEMELVSKTLAYGYNYIEVPTHEWKRKFGVSKINLIKHSWAYCYQLLKICFYKKKKKKTKSFYKESSWYKK